MKHFFLLSILASLFVLSGCTATLTTLYGMKKIKPMSKNAINQSAKRYHIPSEDSYEMDTNYFSYLFSLDSVRYKRQIKNHTQPLQALYFDRSNQLVSFHVNCYAGGFPNLKWNRFGIFDEFVPKQQAPLDSILPLDKQLTFLIPLNNNSLIKRDEYDYIIIVYWSRFMGRQSKRLVRIVQENVAKSSPQQAKIIYVNNDNIFAKEE